MSARPRELRREVWGLFKAYGSSTEVKIAPGLSATMEDSDKANIIKFVQSASRIVSSAAIIISSQSIQKHEEEFGTELTYPQRRRIEEWLSQRINEANMINRYDGITRRPLASTNPPQFGDPLTTSELNPLNFNQQFAGLLLHDNSDVEYQLIQKWCAEASIAFEAGKYLEAEEILKKVRKQSNTRYGSEYEWRDLTTQMLLIIYDKLSNWKELETILLERFREEYKNQDLVALSTTMSVLGRVHFYRKDFRNALIWTHMTIRVRKVIWGDAYVMVYHAIDLLIQIYEASGDQLEADGFRGLLTFDIQNGMFLSYKITDIL
jgi:tetratricopeptide (TPR) repeat protein